MMEHALCAHACDPVLPLPLRPGSNTGKPGNPRLHPSGCWCSPTASLNSAPNIPAPPQLLGLMDAVPSPPSQYLVAAAATPALVSGLAGQEGAAGR